MSANKIGLSFEPSFAPLQYNFSSELKPCSSPVNITWKIDDFKSIYLQASSDTSYMSKIFCRFETKVYQQDGTPQRPITYCLMLKSHKNSKAEYCPSLVLELESGDSGGDVFVNAKVVLLNSRNKSIFSDSAVFKRIPTYGDRKIVWTLGATWAEFMAKVTSGAVTVNFSLEQEMWSNVKTAVIGQPPTPITAARKIEEECVSADLKKLFESGDNSDVTFKLMEGTLIPAHKSILSARSPVFKSMFSADMKETKDNVVELIDIGEEALKVLFVYIYSGELNLKNKSTRCLAEVVNAADKYQLSKMKKLCEFQLPDCCDFLNAFELLKLARLHDLQTAKERISSYIEHNISRILVSTTD